MRAIARLMSVPAEKRDPIWLLDALQAALQLELSTIPPIFTPAGRLPVPVPRESPAPLGKLPARRCATWRWLAICSRP